ncbi:hypothetical protein SAMN05444487_112123 [Marininema mesophilum]|uniref:Uncharacterized protein n=1 Tax=Marininema mesophilum TaxID=1048340 RepID=A0A1H3A413_9BACL|nr:hypothetical protein SAMN05444487_112123 [Marininema mesophilum]
MKPIGSFIGLIIIIILAIIAVYEYIKKGDLLP